MRRFLSLIAILLAFGIPALAQATSYRPILTGTTTYYVRTDGNDTACTGLTDAAFVSGTYPQDCAFLTWQGAINTIEAFDLNNHSVTIKAGAEGSAKTFSGGMNITGLVGGGNLYLEPSSSGTTITGSLPGGGAISLGNSSDVNVWLGPLVLQATGAGYGTVMVTGGAQLLFEVPNGPTFGCTNRSSDIWIHDNLAMVQITNSTFGISCNQNSFLQVTDNSHAFIEASTINFTNTPAFSGAFLEVTAASSLQYVNNHYIGTATGYQFSVTLNSVLNTEGGGTATIPGSKAGIISSGGVVDTLTQRMAGQTFCSETRGSSSCTATVSVGSSFLQCSANYDRSGPGRVENYVPLNTTYDQARGNLTIFASTTVYLSGIIVLDYVCSQ